MGSDLITLRERLASLNADDRTAVVAALSDREAAALLHDWPLWARPDQLPPPGEWRVWLILAGRGWGKTRALMQWAIEGARRWPGSRGALVGATAADARDILIEGESGLLTLAPPDFQPRYWPSKRRIDFPNGSRALVFSADEPNRLRGVQHHWAACDELAAWVRPEAFDMLLMGLRLGDDPRCAIATTPRPSPLIKRLLADPAVAVTRGTTFDNAANLAPGFIAGITRRYDGTRLGRQELYADLLDDAPGALFTRDAIEAARVTEPPTLKRIVIAIDPAASTGADADETGIVAAGVSASGDAYVLEDGSLSASPDGWARAAIALYHKHRADRIVAEANNGGEMVAHTLRTVDPRAPITLVRASRGKQTRAEPIAALYEQGRVHHVGVWARLEDQLCGWTPGDGDSPDRLDALVWALSALLLAGGDPDEAIAWRTGRVKRQRV